MLSGALLGYSEVVRREVVPKASKTLLSWRPLIQ
jgi:hypothetical protein